MCVSSTIHLKHIKYLRYLFSFKLFVDFPDTILLNTLNVILILPENMLYDSNQMTFTRLIYLYEHPQYTCCNMYIVGTGDMIDKCQYAKYG